MLSNIPTGCLNKSLSNLLPHNYAYMLGLTSHLRIQLFKNSTFKRLSKIGIDIFDIYTETKFQKIFS